MPDADKLPRQLTALRGTQLDSAPDLPGIYAWYPRPGLHPSDAKARLDIQGQDRAPGDIVRALRKYVYYYNQPNIELTGKGTYDLSWIGQIALDTISNTSDSGPRIESRIDEVLNDTDLRRSLIDTIQNSIPIFASPLYIGVAKSLKSRLAEHRESYERAKAQLPSTSDFESLRFDAPNFGTRLAAAGVKLDAVECWVLPVSSADDEVASARTTAEAAEWLLQRTFQPVMGKR